MNRQGSPSAALNQPGARARAKKNGLRHFCCNPLILLAEWTGLNPGTTQVLESATYSCEAARIEHSVDRLAVQADTNQVSNITRIQRSALDERHRRTRRRTLHPQRQRRDRRPDIRQALRAEPSPLVVPKCARRATRAPTVPGRPIRKRP